MLAQVIADLREVFQTIGTVTLTILAAYVIVEFIRGKKNWE